MELDCNFQNRRTFLKGLGLFSLGLVPFMKGCNLFGMEKKSPEEKEKMELARDLSTPRLAIPPIDLIKPSHAETATFALA
jgi:hypothetical protein